MIEVEVAAASGRLLHRAPAQGAGTHGRDEQRRCESNRKVRDSDAIRSTATRRFTERRVPATRSLRLSQEEVAEDSKVMKLEASFRVDVLGGSQSRSLQAWRTRDSVLVRFAEVADVVLPSTRTSLSGSTTSASP